MTNATVNMKYTQRINTYLDTFKSILNTIDIILAIK